MRFLKDGSRDQSFGVNGRVSTNFGSHEEALAVAARIYNPHLPEIVVAAGFTDFGGDRNFALARYDASTGGLLTAFGWNGMVTTDFGGLDDVASAVAIQSDGKIVAAGWSQSGGGNGIDFALARYLGDGSLDPEFSGDGMLTTHIPLPGPDNWATCMAIQADGKIVVAGHGGGGFSGGPDSAMIVARYHGQDGMGAAGSLDATFGNLGIQTVSFDGGATVVGMTIQDDGKIILVGKGATNTVLARITPGGVLDPGFGGDGRVAISVKRGTSTATSDPVAVALQADSKIVVTGQCQIGTREFLFVTRLGQDGELDTPFGRRGFGFYEYGRAAALLIDDDGKLLVGGNSTLSSGFQVFRFLIAQGDLRIGHAGKRPIGNDIYGYNPMQQMLQTAFHRKGTRKRFSVTIQNDGPVQHSFKFRAHSSGSAFPTAYFSGNKNVSAAARSGKFLTGPLAAGRSKPLVAVVRSESRKRFVARLISMDARSFTDEFANDSTSIRATFKASNKPRPSVFTPAAPFRSRE